MENATTNVCVCVFVLDDGKLYKKRKKESKVDKRLTHSQFVAALKDYDN